jgi:hypothetical protein
MRTCGLRRGPAIAIRWMQKLALAAWGGFSIIEAVRLLSIRLALRFQL